MSQNIFSLDGLMYDRVWEELYDCYISREIDETSEFVHKLNYCGHVVKLQYFLNLGYKNIEDFFGSISWLKPRIIFYETDPNIKISEVEGDDKEYGAEFLDHYSIHLHRVENAIAINNTNATINFPLLNCNEDSTTSWYKLKDGQILDTGYLSRTEDSSVELIEETNLKDRQCNLMRMDRWHSVKNNTGKRRVIANWDFHHYVPWDDAVELLIR